MQRRNSSDRIKACAVECIVWLFVPIGLIAIAVFKFFGNGMELAKFLNDSEPQAYEQP